MDKQLAANGEELFDIAVIGAGFGGIYAAHRLSRDGHSVVGIEGASDIGGTWYHNGYPGSRVDTDSVDLYSYLFDREIYRGWQWTERYAAQPEIMAYVGWVADRLDVRRLFRFDSWLRHSRWSEEDKRWHLETSQGHRIACRFLVMCTGNLSEPKPIPWPGLERFQGEWHQTNRWPHRPVDFKGKRVAVVGTGSSGVQAVPVIAGEAARLTVFQRSPHYGVPAVNGPADHEKYRWICDHLEEFKETMLARPTLPWGQDDRKKANAYTRAEQLERMEAQWAFGGHGMAYVFEDIGHDWASNKVASDFVCDKIRAQLDDKALAEKMCPDYPIGTRRLILEIGYYPCFNQPHVSLHDMRDDPIEEITATGIRTRDRHYELDTLVFALGFKPFLGAIDTAGVVNPQGLSPRDVWARGPRTLFGLMTPGFPNLFHTTNAGSPSVLGPLILENEFHVDWIADCLAEMAKRGSEVVEATEAGADLWGAKSAKVAEHMLRRRVDNYMVHVNADDGSRVFQPWGAGMVTYVPEVRAMTANRYEGCAFR